MKKTGILVCVLLGLGGLCFAADPAEGYWLSVDEKTGKVTAGWEIYQEGGRLFGKILSTADHPPGVIADKCDESYRGFPAAGKVNQMPVAGTPWIFGLSPEKQSGRWSGGNVIDPNDGKMYKCRIIFRAAGTGKFTADTLEMRGEIGLGIGRSQFWQKTGRQQAGALGPG
jgi:uncharacterized protein (DUF2147 family)